MKLTDAESHSLIEVLKENAALKAALTKVHGIVAEYWGPCMGSVETLATIRDALGEVAKNWRPALEGPGEEDGPWAKGWAQRSGQETKVDDETCTACDGTGRDKTFNRKCDCQ